MKILVSGLLNTETKVAVKEFPIEYYPIDYPFFGINTATAGVAFNISKALRTLGNDVKLTSIIGNDFTAQIILNTLKNIKVNSDSV